MTEVIEQPFKRFCPQGHDTWVHGRNSNNGCKTCQRESNRRTQRARRTERERLRRLGTSMYLPEFGAFRERRGHSAADVAFFCQHVSEERLEAIETQQAAATHNERIELFQAIRVLDDRRREEAEAKLEGAKRLERAGLL